MTTDEAAAGADPDGDQPERITAPPPVDGENLNELARIAISSGVLDDPKTFRRLWLLINGPQLIATAGRLLVAVAFSCAPGATYLVIVDTHLTWSDGALPGASILAFSVVVLGLVRRRRRHRKPQPPPAPANAGSGRPNPGGKSKPPRAQQPKRRKQSPKER